MATNYNTTKKNPYALDEWTDLLSPVFEINRQVNRNTYNNQSSIFDKYMNTIASETIRKGSKLSKEELQNIIGANNYKWYRDDQFDTLYDEFVSNNYDILFSEEARQQQMSSEVQMFMNAFKQQTNPETGLTNEYQSYLDALNAASQDQYNIAMQELDVAENQMLRSIGLSQRQMERDIAKRRQQALKSGMSTAQLAAQEQQNILAAQTCATQIAQQYTDQRYNTINQFAGAQSQNYANVLGQQVNAQNNIYNSLISAWTQDSVAKNYGQQ